MKKIKIILVLIIAILSFVSCVEPSPLYGVWADNKGNKLSILADETYTSEIVNAYNEKEDSSGTYTVFTNVITFISEDGGTVRTTEWDIRSNILYLNWTDNSASQIQSLVLYKIAN